MSQPDPQSATRNELSVHWGGGDLLRDFHAIFSRNMRDLGMPNFGRRLFRSILEEFPAHAELCLVRLDRKPVAAAMLLHGPNMTEVPTGQFATGIQFHECQHAHVLAFAATGDRPRATEVRFRPRHAGERPAPFQAAMGPIGGAGHLALLHPSRQR